MQTEAAIQTGEKLTVRVEATETQLYTEYYDIDSNDLPGNWKSMSQDEQHMFVRARGTLVKKKVDETQERTDGVFLSLEVAQPEWTVTFTYTQSEIVSAANREEAINKARLAIASTYKDPNGAIPVLGDAEVDVVSGRWGL